MGVVQLSVFFLLAFHHNRLLQIHSYYNLIWFFSFLESVIWSQGQWRFWSISADALEQGLQCSRGRHSPGSTELSLFTLGFSIDEQMPPILPARTWWPTPGCYSFSHLFLDSVNVYWAFTCWLKKKIRNLKVEHYVLFGRRLEDFKPGTQRFR